jgi:uncharacterized coiled-coil DUF342 family protein
MISTITCLVSVLDEPDKRGQIVNQIQVLESEISLFKKKLDEQYNLADEYVETRNQYNESRRLKLNEVQSLKEKRDHFNDFVKAQKNLLIEKRDNVRENIEEIQQHQQLISDALFNVKISKDEAQNRVGDLDWKLQTNPTNIEEEKKIASEIKKFQIIIVKYSRVESNKKEIQRLQDEIDILRKEIEMTGEQIKIAVNQSQVHHKEMIQRFQESNELKNHADNAHRDFLEVKKNVNDIRKKLTNKQEMLSKLVYKLKKLDSLEKEVKSEKEEERVSSIVTRTQRKIKDGEKVTFDEFKLLLERDLFKSSKKE